MILNSHKSHWSKLDWKQRELFNKIKIITFPIYSVKTLLLDNNDPIVVIPFLTQVEAAVFQKQSPMSKQPSWPMSKTQSSHLAAM